MAQAQAVALGALEHGLGSIEFALQALEESATIDGGNELRPRIEKLVSSLQTLLQRVGGTDAKRPVRRSSITARRPSVVITNALVADTIAFQAKQRDSIRMDTASASSKPTSATNEAHSKSPTAVKADAQQPTPLLDRSLSSGARSSDPAANLKFKSRKNSADIGNAIAQDAKYLRMNSGKLPSMKKGLSALEDGPVNAPAEHKNKNERKASVRIHPSDEAKQSKPSLSGSRIRRMSKHVTNTFARWATRTKLTESETRMAKEAFKAIDVNGDGVLSPEELFSVLACMGLRPSVVELHEVLREFDRNGDGEIEKDEFLQMMTVIKDQQAAKGVELSSMLNSMTDLVTDMYNQKLEGDVIGNSPYILHPKHPAQGVWDLFISVLLGVTMITIPLTLGFEGLSDSMLETNVAIDMFFCLDILKNFNSGYQDDEGVTILDRRMISWAYFRTWFLPDLISSIPLELMIPDSSGSGSAADGGGSSSQYTRTTKSMKLLRLIKLAKLVRLLRVNRVFKYFRMLTQLVSDHLGLSLSDSGLVNLGRLFFQVLLIAHWIGCLNFMLCRLYDFPEESWVVRLGIRDASTADQWSWSFFKALSYMIGVGLDTGGVTTNCMDENDQRYESNWCEVENWTILLCLYVGAVFCALLISEVSSIIINLNSGSRALRELMLRANQYMSDNRLPFDLRDKVRKYLRMKYNAHNLLYDEQDLLDMLPGSLVEDIMTHKSRDIVELVPVLKEHSADFQNRCCSAITPYIAFQDDTIFRQDSTGNSIFFIFAGVVSIVSEPMRELADRCLGEWSKTASMQAMALPSTNNGAPADADAAASSGLAQLQVSSQLLAKIKADPMQAREDAVLAVITNGCYFGDVGLFFNVKRTATCQASTLCNLYELNQKALFRLVDGFPDERLYMIEVAAARMSRVEVFNAAIESGAVWGDDRPEFQDEEDMKTDLLAVANSSLGKAANAGIPVMVNRDNPNDQPSISTVNRAGPTMTDDDRLDVDAEAAAGSAVADLVKSGAIGTRNSVSRGSLRQTLSPGIRSRRVEQMRRLDSRQASSSGADLRARERTQSFARRTTRRRNSRQVSRKPSVDFACDVASTPGLASSRRVSLVHRNAEEFARSRGSVAEMSQKVLRRYRPTSTPTSTPASPVRSSAKLQGQGAESAGAE